MALHEPLGEVSLPLEEAFFSSSVAGKLIPQDDHEHYYSCHLTKNVCAFCGHVEGTPFGELSEDARDFAF